MKKNKIKLNKNDFYRVLLTDVLPYEVPFIYTNEGFYKKLTEWKREVKGKAQKKPLLKEVFYPKDVSETYPIEYHIAKDSDSNRKLYIIHPSAQLKIVELYKKYHQLMSHLCSRSSFSLRYPEKMAYAYFSENKDSLDKFKDEGVSLEGDDPKYASTFFEYKDFDFLYKYYDSYSFHRAERKFNNLYKFDIAKCFASISTFNLSLSMRGIFDHNKYCGEYSFESEFEKAMKYSNGNKSHGIVVGPEFSRVFSEVLFQSIDIKIKNSLLNVMDGKGNYISLVENRDYILKRYVDDYFLFFNNENVRKLIYDISVKELEKNNLYTNESKNILLEIPFVTGVTLAKGKMKKILDDFFDIYHCASGADDIVISKNMAYYNKQANSLIISIKGVLHECNVAYSNITGFFFTLVKTFLVKVDSTKDKFSSEELEKEKFTRFMLILIEVCFFVYSMDYRVRSTYLVSQIVILINRITGVLEEVKSQRLKKKIYDEAYSVISSSLNKGLARSVESLNLLIAIRDIDINYQMEPDVLERTIGINNNESNANYFSLMVCLFYTQNKIKYLQTRDKVVRVIIGKFSRCDYNILNDSELLHLFLDSMSCPFITKKKKADIANAALTEVIEKKHFDFFIKECSGNNWFIDWDTKTTDAIERLLMKKELKSPYGN